MGDGNVVTLTHKETGGLLIGPFTEYRVVIERRFIPHLTGRQDGDTVWLTVDGRFTSPFGSGSV